MRRDLSFAGRLLLSLVLAVLVFSHPAVGQSVGRPPSYGSDAAAAIGEVLRQGRQLEVERRWAEALTLYEEAVRQFPGERSLEVRFEATRLHYDLGRRYCDRSYREMLRELSLAETLDLYSEVLLKIQAHYVEAPNWKGLVERGTNSLEVALTEPAFLAYHAPTADDWAVNEFRGELRRRLGPMVIQTRDDARQAVALAADMAAERLGLSPSAVVLEYTCGATNSLDLYSAYLTPDQLAEVYAQIEGNFVGLGVELKAAAGALLIVRVIPGSPAERAGVLAGDLITSVDGRSTRDLSTEEAANLLHGEVGSTAELTVQTPGSPPRQVTIRRDHVDVPSIDEARILEGSGGIGYIKLTCFQKTTHRDLDAALWSLYQQGMRSLVLDLRGNPGGLLVTAVEVVDKFVDEGIIVSTRGRSSQEDFTYSAHASGTWRVPLVVLIDQESASAAEIFAGAIRDHHRGTIVGWQSYGKGSVQGIFPLSFTTGGVRLTTARFYSPSGHPYSGTGVQPDLLVHQAAREVYDLSAGLRASGDEDPALAAAVQAARRSLAQR